MNTDASRFLAQSQSRLATRQPDDNNRNQLVGLRRQNQNEPRLGNPRYLSRLGGAGSQFSNFPFASRGTQNPAPLFYSAADDFREEDDEAEHEREVADFYALQRSRRQFVNSRLDSSEEADGDDASRGSGLQESGEAREDERRGRVGGIRSSWTGDRQYGPRRKTVDLLDDRDTRPPLERVPSEGSSRSQMYDVRLEDTLKSGHDQDEPPNDLTIEIPEDDPPSIQQFKKTPRNPFSPYLPQETDDEARRERPPPPDSDASSVPPTVGITPTEPPRHDVFWGNLYLISLIALFASFVLVYLHTSLPAKGLGDTIYSTLHGSFYLLAIDTLVAIVVSLVWLALLRSYVRPLVYTLLISVPVILFAFTLYPFISSFQASEHTSNFQDTAMRWFSSLPGIMATIWVYGVWQSRHAFEKAIGILEFACKILAANPELLLLGFGTLAAVVVWTWVWMAMFSRVFLGGHLVNSFFIVDVGTWWLGAFFVLVYLWTLGVQAGLQRAATAATVSQWYFHRLAEPAPTSRQVVRAALAHALAPLFGTVCLSALLALLVRVPVLVLPRRALALVGLFSTMLIPNAVLILTHPTTLTYAAIHSQPLAAAARAVAQLSFTNPAANNPAARFRSRPVNAPRTTAVPPHRLALLLLHATRLIMALALGFGAWVRMAASTQGTRGSLYAYVVGLVASAIGWAVLGAMEGVLTGIVDAVVVCWASEVRNGEVKYCREAGWLLGDGHEPREEREGLLGR